MMTKLPLQFWLWLGNKCLKDNTTIGGRDQGILATTMTNYKPQIIKTLPSFKQICIQKESESIQVKRTCENELKQDI